MIQDILYALRQFRRNPGFAAVGIVVIALGIGANTAIFSLIQAVILKPLPYSDPGRLVSLWETRPDRGFKNNVVSAANYLDWRAHNSSFSAMSAYVSRTQTLTGAGEPEEVQSQGVEEAFFPMLGIPMAMGRGFTAAECKPGAAPVAILSDSLWRRKFSADPSIVGRTIRLNSEAVTVVGVAPPGILTPADRKPEMWQALRIQGVNSNGTRVGGRNFAVLARLKPGVTVERADLEMRTMAKQLERAYPLNNANWSAKAMPLSTQMYGRVRTPLLVLLGAVGLILVIACANVANLMLSRAAGRQRELAIRASLGAGRGRLARQTMVESLTLAVCGGALGIALAYGLLKAFKLFGPADVPRLERAALDGTVLLFTAAATVLTGLAMGLAPALLSARHALGTALQEGGRGSTPGRTSNRLRDVFTVAQVAFALMLLVGAGLLLRSFSRLTSVDPGFRTDHVLTFDVSLPGTRYQNGKDVRFFSELDRRLRALPGVVNASLVTFLPFKGMGSATYFWRADRPKPEPGREPVADVRMAQPGYFETLAIPLRRGRTFNDADNDEKAPLRFVINEDMAREAFPGEDPIGKRLIVQMQSNNPPGEIIGITGDVKHGSLADKVRPMVYYPQAHLSFAFGTVVVETRGEPMSLARAVTGVVRELDPELPVSELGTMRQWVDESLSRTKFQTGLIAAFAGLALLLAVLGVYGVISYGVRQRVHEIGVRVALGAQRGQVLRMVLGRALVLTLCGLALGLAGALALGRYLETLLFEIEPSDPATLAFLTVLLLAMALLAALLPAIRATRVHPMEVLRYVG